MVRPKNREEARLEEINALQAATDRRWSKLNESKAFLIETHKLTNGLEKALAQNPKYVKRFFRRFGYPTGRFKAINKFLSSISDKQTRDAIAAYPRYVARFGVLMKLWQKAPHFRPYPLSSCGSVFSVRLKNGEFLPAGHYPGGDDPYIYFYESDPANAPEFFQSLIESGAAKFVEIDDQDKSSLFTRLELFAYSSETITFLIHRAEQPYLFCLIGGDVTNSTWRGANKAISAF